MVNRALCLLVMTGLVSGLTALPQLRWQGCQWLAWAAEIREVGTDGSRGRDGRAGRTGSAGPNQSVTADGSALRLDLSGADGSSGEAGEAGQRPWCGSQPSQVSYDVQMPDGGDGGDGGNGGDGGSGGSLLVYYTDPNALRQLTVVAAGGRGGRGGPGGSGAYGCRCDRDSWTLQTCTGTPGAADYRCRDERYVCRDGGSGYNGAAGRDGQDGQAGQVRLVNQLTPLPPEVPQLSTSLSELVSRPASVSKHLWEARSGAGALLSPGSIVADQYLSYRGRVEGQVQLVWQAPRSLESFASEAVQAEIGDSGEITLRFAEDLWIAAASSRADRLTTVTVTGAVRASEATRLAWGSTEGSGRDLSLSVVDLGRQSAYLDTRFRVVLKTSDDDPRDDRTPRYTVRYDDWVPAELVSQQGDRFVISLGRLPIGQQALRRGSLAQIELTATRSLGSNAAEQTLSWQGQF